MEYNDQNRNSHLVSDKVSHVVCSLHKSVQNCLIPTLAFQTFSSSLGIEFRVFSVFSGGGIVAGFWLTMRELASIIASMRLVIFKRQNLEGISVQKDYLSLSAFSPDLSIVKTCDVLSKIITTKNVFVLPKFSNWNNFSNFRSSRINSVVYGRYHVNLEHVCFKTQLGDLQETNWIIAEIIER